MRLKFPKQLALALLNGFALVTCWLFLPVFFASNSAGESPAKVFLAGAYAIDISPQKFPIAVNGGFVAKFADHIVDPLHARCLVLDDGKSRIAMVVVDNCELPRELLDKAKEMAREKTGIPTNRILISTTHTHTAPAAIGALGTDIDPDYVQFLPVQIAKGIELAVKNLAPAKIGWGVIQAPEYTHCRRWITRPDKVKYDPFGEQSVRAMMHPGYQNPDFLAPSGPVDSGLSLLSVQTLDARPIALLANYSQHYFGSQPISADYYGRFAADISHLIGADNVSPAFVGIMSQGTSGDQMWMDYSLPKAPNWTLDGYAQMVADRAYEAYQRIQYHDWVPLAMAETTITLGVRLPSPERLARSKQIVAQMPDPLPTLIKDVPRYEEVRDVYAREQVLLVERGPKRELKLQAIRIGELGITAIPDEVFAITGLEIKRLSPLQPTFTIELANGGEGYIPPPEQHVLGGYTTWAARTAALEPTSAPKIVALLTKLLTEVSGKPPQPLNDEASPYDKGVLASNPAVFWRMHEFSGPAVTDFSGKNLSGSYEPGVVFYLEGPPAMKMPPEGMDRAAQFAGGRAKGNIPGLGDHYSVEMWFYNELPVDLRAVTGFLFTRGSDSSSDQLGVGGIESGTGKLFFTSGEGHRQFLEGKTAIAPNTWNHVVMVRDGEKLSVYLNGDTEPDISGTAAMGFSPALGQVFIGGGTDYSTDFYGKICEVSIYGHCLTAQDISRHYAAAVGN